MSQFKTFVLPSESDANTESGLNTFLRSHRIVSITKAYDGGVWRFCIEWLDEIRGDLCARGVRYAERVDYMKILPPNEFSVFAKLREKRKASRGRP